MNSPQLLRGIQYISFSRYCYRLFSKMSNNQKSSKRQTQPMVAAPVSVTKSAQQKRKTQKKGKRNNVPQKGGFATSRDLVPAGVSVSTRGIGMSDLINHRVSYLTGYIYVGNGTLGATDSVYFIEPTGTYTVCGGPIAVVPSDPTVGASYVTDVDKHFSRKVVKRTFLRLEPLYPSTANSMSVIVGPLRGPAGSALSLFKSDTTAANAYTNVLSLSGSVQAASWEDLIIDLTPYIAGGSGAKQNEFAVAIQGPIADSFGVAGFNPINVPCCFAVSGHNSTSALRGTQTHAVIIEQVYDLVDFVGGFTTAVSLA